MRKRMDYSNHTREQLQKLCELADLSIPSLQFALKESRRISKQRMVKLKLARAALKMSQMRDVASVNDVRVILQKS